MESNLYPLISPSPNYATTYFVEFFPPSSQASSPPGASGASNLLSKGYEILNNNILVVNFKNQKISKIVYYRDFSYTLPLQVITTKLNKNLIFITNSIPRQGSNVFIMEIFINDFFFFWVLNLRFCLAEVNTYNVARVLDHNH